MRTALGATRWRIVRAISTQSVLLSLVGGALGVLLAVWGIDLLLALSPSSVPRKYEINIDGWAVLGFTFAVSLATGVLFGLAPAFQVSRFNLSETLKEGARGSTGGSTRMRSTLVVAEIALSLVLLIGAGLLLKSFAHLIGTDAGFNPKNVAAMNITLSYTRYKDDGPQVRFFKQVLEKVRALPGVVAVGGVSDLPLGGAEEVDQFTLEGSPAPKSVNDTPLGDYRFVDDGYFSTLGISLVAGRYFTEHDTDTAPPVVVVSESLARRFFADENPVGKRLSGDFDSRGALGHDCRTGQRRQAFGARQRSSPAVVLSISAKVLGAYLHAVARTTADARSLFAGMRDAVWEVDKDQPIVSLKTLEEYLDDSVSQQRFNALLLAAFAVIALRRCIGIYGDERRRSRNARTSLASAWRLAQRRMMCCGWSSAKAWQLALAGVGIGIVTALGVTRVMASLRHGVSATDPLTFMVVSVVLAGVALGASFIPARRATKVDPMVALRYE